MAKSLAEDIIINILLRLPAKSSVRFKCVYKCWRLKAGDLIPSQRIIIGSRHRPLETIDYETLSTSMHVGARLHKVAAFDKLKSTRFFTLFPSVPIEEDHRRPKRSRRREKPSGESSIEKRELRKVCVINPSRVVGSCDGLVFLIGPCNFLIYNPTTREYIELPEGDVGVGNWAVAIFSLKSGSWRSIQVEEKKHSHIKFISLGVYWNGALHWCVYDLSIKDNWETVIMSFHLLEEKINKVLQVPEVDKDIDSWELGIHGPNLFIFNCGHHTCIEAWKTGEYGRGATWTKWFSVSPFRRSPSYAQGVEKSFFGLI
ncbi:hypothetical protein BT93_J0039 [Corymbia citriodora subsp. variegata]|nr:hypothetical protein BT93_J0039 [Corymbia citriodora subsp. variegata]